MHPPTSRSAFGYGNETALINDVFTDPLGEVEKHRPHLSKSMCQNCLMLEVLVCGWVSARMPTHPRPHIRTQGSYYQMLDA